MIRILLYVLLIPISGIVLADYPISVVNNVTQTLPAGYRVCAQGFTNGSSTSSGLTGPFLVLQSNGKFGVPTITTKNTSLPVLDVTDVAGTAMSLNNASFNLVGGRIYFYVVNGPCTTNNSWLLTYSSSTSVNQPDPASSPYQYSPYIIAEFTTGTGASLDIDLTIVDALMMVGQISVPEGQSGTAYYSSVGQTTVTPYSNPQSLNSFDALFKTWADSVSNGGPYQALVEAPSATYGESSGSYPQSVFPIINPGQFLRLTRTTGAQSNATIGGNSYNIFNPNVGSPLNSNFDDALSEVFSNPLHISYDIISHNVYLGEPGLDFSVTVPGPTQPSISVKGTGFCVVTPKNAVITSCGSSPIVYALLDPRPLSVVSNPRRNTADETSGLIIGSEQQNTSTLTFSDGGMPDGTLKVGMFVKGAVGSAASGYLQIQSCTPACSGSGPITSVTVGGYTKQVNNGVTSWLKFNGFQVSRSNQQYVFSKIPLGTTSAVFQSSGAQVFAGYGVFDGSLSTSSANSSPTVTYNNVPIPADANLGNVVVSALNRGVAAQICSKTNTCAYSDSDSMYWNTMSNWYPSGVKAQNLYAYFLHSQTDQTGKPLFIRPSNAVNQMAMAYGFSYDENPMDNSGCGDSSPCPSFSQVPSEFSAVSAGSNVTITLGPFLNQSQSGTVGVCGSSYGGSFETAPSSNLCQTGQPSSVTGPDANNHWNWSCAGTEGSPAQCWASKPSVGPVTNGDCGTANGGSFSTEPPYSQLCSSGAPSLVQQSGNDWVWSCVGSGGGRTASCSATNSGGHQQNPIVIKGLMDLRANRGEFISYSGGSGNGAVSYSVKSSGKVVCSIQKINGRPWLRTMRGAGACYLTVTKAASGSYSAASSTHKVVVR